MCCIKMLTIVLVALAVSSTVSTLKVGRPRTNEIKQGQTFSLCGDTFVMAWKYMCKFKYQRSLQKNKLRSRSKRSVENFVKLSRKTHDFVSKTGATTFLKTRHRREVLRGGLDNANEECCYETCSYGEIAEYDC